MIRIRPAEWDGLRLRLPEEVPGPAVMCTHVQTTGLGRCWVDRLLAPRAVAVRCGGHTLLMGDPSAVPRGRLADLIRGQVAAPARFLPRLMAEVGRVRPWERMVYAHRFAAPPTSPPPGFQVRSLVAADAARLIHLGPEAAWIAETWGGPVGLAASGHARGAVTNGALAAVACVYFHGRRHAELAVVTAPWARRLALARACVTALCADVRAEGRVPTWTAARDNTASRRLAWTCGFRLVCETTHYSVEARPARTAA
ncbi:GNAT family N-acetyltransferase [Embleya sp. AB8]|uniref:GNAT family N-acetyltransferase n=1 Tax=Embleya sp. AB8 TaxID=3156304 RepID=UPI003C72A301